MPATKKATQKKPAAMKKPAADAAAASASKSTEGTQMEDAAKNPTEGMVHLDWQLLQEPYSTFIREMYNSQRRLRPIMHPQREQALGDQQL